MNFIGNLSFLVLALISFLLGVFVTRLLSGKDKYLIRQLSTDLAVAEEKLKQFQNREAEFKQLQQLFIETKTHNAELQTRIDEQAKNTAEKLKLLLDAELRLNTQFENLAGKIFDERSKQLTEHHKTSLDHIVTPLREQLGEVEQRIETVLDNENEDRIRIPG